MRDNQARARTGANHFDHPIRNDWLQRHGLERGNILPGRGARAKARCRSPGEVVPFTQGFQANGRAGTGLSRGARRNGFGILHPFQSR